MGPGAVIILNTSWLNRVGTPGLSLLSASKAAVRSFARTLSAELLPRGIRVNAVSPGAIDTPIRRRGNDTEEAVRASNDRLAARIPLKRLGESEDIANAALYLAMRPVALRRWRRDRRRRRIFGVVTMEAQR